MGIFILLHQDFIGNTDRNTIVRQTINPPVVAQWIQLFPIEWQGGISLRMELLGCRGNLHTSTRMMKAHIRW